MANARMEVTRAAGKELYQLFKAFQGGSVKLEGQFTKEALNALKTAKEGGLERFIAGMENPAYRASGAVTEAGANFDVAILNGKEIVMSANGEAVVPKDAEGFFSYLGKLIGMRKEKLLHQAKHIEEKIEPKTLEKIKKINFDDVAAVKEKMNKMDHRLDEAYHRIHNNPKVLREDLEKRISEAEHLGIDISDLL